MHYICVFEHAQLGDDVCLRGVGAVGFFEGVDGVECKEGVAFVRCDETLAVFAIDNVPHRLGGWVEWRYGVDDVAMVK